MDMTTFEADGLTLEKIREHVWKLPQSGEMGVSGRVYASEALLEAIAGDKTLSQLQNAAHLPGMVDPVITMPDGHQGYGFPVGGVGATDAEDGCISPGAVGYDINCLPADAEVHLDFGRRLDLGELAARFEDEAAVVAGDRLTTAPIQLFTASEEKPVYAVETTTGERIEATPDHQFQTPEGMVALEELEPGDRLRIQPFRGLQDEAPADVTVIEETDGDSNHCPLSTADSAFTRLLGLLGFLRGSGTITDEGHVHFYGAPEDLDALRADLRQLGFSPTPIEDATTEDGVRVSDPELARLLVALDADPTSTPAPPHPPAAADVLTDWQLAVYYAAYFGAAMAAPTGGPNGQLKRPTVGLADTSVSARRALERAVAFLDSIGITATTEATEDQLTLAIENDLDNLRQFFATVGYRYHQRKRQAAVAAIQYCKTVTPRDSSSPRAVADGGPSAAPEADFTTFRKQCAVGDDLTIETTIASIEPAGEKPVYDIGVTHPAHTFLANEFVVSNCGVRMIKTNLTYDDLRGHEEELVETLFTNIPTGLGGGGIVEVDRETVDEILERGVEWAVDNGYGVSADLEHCEDEGRHPAADSTKVSDNAKDRGRKQIGSLGSGNHFLEVQRVTDVYRSDVAAEFGLTEDQVVVLIHCGSRGLGHQTCTDYLREIEQTHRGLLDRLPDKELAAAPAGSQLAEDYYGAMCAAVNFAWVNRQLITHRTRQVFQRVFDRRWEDLGMDLLYDVAHNIAKRETHTVDGRERELFVHRKGATRAFPAGHPAVPPAYRSVGQPVIIPGSMGAGSYVLRGGERSLDLSFGSTAHGAGRLMSRTQAKNEFWGEDVKDRLEEHNAIYVRAESGATVAEEAPGVYKDVDEVVEVSDALGIGDKVARTFPVCNIKG